MAISSILVAMAIIPPSGSSALGSSASVGSEDWLLLGTVSVGERKSQRSE